VYGALTDIALRAQGRRYVPENDAIRDRGIGETRPLDFHSPYGCSKGAAEQYVLDYSRSFGLHTVVLRMSCIYGPHQHGNEDQGWVAHFVRCALQERAITIYGDGKQVRDLLFVEDLVDAFARARETIGALSGCAFNIGGGPANTASVLEVLERIEAQTGNRLDIHFDDWRVGDQRYYVSDTASFSAATGWQPRVGLQEGITTLCEWLAQPQAVSKVPCAGAPYVVAEP
jgi:CDP-paratose 2-epimerase